MLYTSSYKNFNSNLYKGIAISGDAGKNANWDRESYTALAPKRDFFTTWKNNKGKISDEENNKYYMHEFYDKVLSKLEPQTIYDYLCNGFLLCYENNSEFCHRHIVAAWLELFLNIEVKEVKVDLLDIKELEKPEWIKEYLEKIIKENINMKGFNSIRALYLFEKGEKLEQKANEKEKINGNKNYDYLRQAACYLRCEADMAEEEYNNNIKIKKLTKNE